MDSAAIISIGITCFIACLLLLTVVYVMYLRRKVAAAPLADIETRVPAEIPHPPSVDDLTYIRCA